MVAKKSIKTLDFIGIYDIIIIPLRLERTQ